MNEIEIITLKALRKIYGKLFKPESSTYDRGITDPDKASEQIYNLLASGKPCMVARYGSTEMLAITNYLGVTAKHHSVLKYIQGKQFAWWWEDNVKDQMTRWSGFFPSTEENLMKFGEMMVEDSKQVDMLGSWLDSERYILGSNFDRFWLIFLDPFWTMNPWTRILAGKRVLVVHPFAEIIESQYRNHRDKLFLNPLVLPKFELKTIKAIQSIGGTEEYSSWFEALEVMKSEMDAVDYDIVLLGCGAYGFPLAAYAKRKGKQAVHMGGSLQLLFGIKGKRWEDPNYAFRAREKCPTLCYPNLFNKYWIRPSDYRSKKTDAVENGCYW